MKTDEIQQTLTFCKRIGKLILGFDAVKTSIQLDESKLVLFARDLSPKSKKQMEFLCKELEVQTAELPFTMDECWYLVGKRSGIFSVTEKSFAEKLQQQLSKL